MALLLVTLVLTGGCALEASITQLDAGSRVKLDHGSFMSPATTSYKRMVSSESGYNFKASAGGLVKNDHAITNDGYEVLLTNQSVLISFDDVEQ